MGGRADVFIGFYDKALDLLDDGGVLGFICADRWMHNDYGKKLRDKIVSGPFAMDTVVAMHDADAFEADVSGLPGRHRHRPRRTARRGRRIGRCRIRGRRCRTVPGLD